MRGDQPKDRLFANFAGVSFFHAQLVKLVVIILVTGPLNRTVQ